MLCVKSPYTRVVSACGKMGIASLSLVSFWMRHPTKLKDFPLEESVFGRRDVQPVAAVDCTFTREKKTKNLKSDA